MEVSLHCIHCAADSRSDNDRIQKYTDALGRGLYKCTQDNDYNCRGKLILTTEKISVRHVLMAVHVEHDDGHPSHDHEGNADHDEKPGPRRKSFIPSSLHNTNIPARSHTTQDLVISRKNQVHCFCLSHSTKKCGIGCSMAMHKLPQIRTPFRRQHHHTL